MSLICVINSMTIEEANKKYKNYSYKQFKEEVADSVCKFIKNIQEKFYEYRNNEENLKKILESGSDKVRVYASGKIKLVKERVGLKV